MPGEIISFRKARKARDRAAKEKTAAENRVKFGQTKAEKDRVKAETEASARTIDAHRRDHRQPDDGTEQENE